MTATGDHPDPLESYRGKRALERTTEPAGAVGREGGALFVVHMHDATRLHWDLRLEFGGVLLSWAVPKGPSFDQADKRLAVHVEDHPLEYGDFEGVIPQGNYGAGPVILWDRGTWVPVEDPDEGFRKGKLLFELRGYKLRGRWTLVKLKKTEKEWLLIKERDEWMTPGGRPVPDTSVLSGLTVDDLAQARDPAAPIRERLDALQAPAGPVDPKSLQLMLAETAEAPFSREGWVFELKLDGYRVLAHRDGEQVTLWTRNGRDATRTFPEIARAVSGLPFRRFLLDGEVVASDDEGRPSFQRLQQRARFLRAADVRRAALANPVTYWAFDLLAFEDRDLRRLPLRERKALLRQVLPPVGPLPFLDHFDDGEALYAQVERMGLEGIVAKRADGPYRGGRSADWLKVRADRTDDFLVVGFTRPRGSRAGFGALQLADYVDDRLTYAGRVGSGFSAAQLAEVRARLEDRVRDGPPCEGPVPADPETTWVEPELIAEVRYKEFTEEGLLRQPVFVRFRDDKPPAECRRARREPVELADPVEVPEPRRVKISNPKKVFWPGEGHTKGDLIAYYRAIAPWLLPYLADRPVVLTRYPDGIDGKSFFQKDAPRYIPDWLRTERMWSEHASREIDYFVCEDEPSLAYLANMATIPLHIWGSRVATLEFPDWCVLDLDPKDAPWEDVIEVAVTVRALCEEIGLPSYVKTTGSTGLHVLLPLGRRFTYDQCRSFGELLGRVVVDRRPDIATLTRVIERREGKVYLDYLQNGHGRLIVAPFSVRPLPGAPVSMPLEWDEVVPSLRLRDHTIRTAPDRMAALGHDPVRPVLDEVPDLMAVLEALQARLGG